MAEKFQIKQMLLIGSTGRNSGKTTLAVEFAKAWKEYYPVIGLKVTTIQERNGKCPRGGDGCGVCTGIKSEYEISEELHVNCNKDTSILLAAGLQKVFWLKALHSHLYEGIISFMGLVSESALIICESNSLRKIVSPGGFIMIDNQNNLPRKKSAIEVMDFADITVTSDVSRVADKIINSFIVSQNHLGIEISHIKN